MERARWCNGIWICRKARNRRRTGPARVLPCRWDEVAASATMVVRWWYLFYVGGDGDNVVVVVVIVVGWW